MLSDKSEANRTKTQHIGAPISERWDKYWRIVIFCDTTIWFRKILERWSSSAGCNSALKTPYPPLPYNLLSLYTSGFTWYHSIKAIHIKIIPSKLEVAPNALKMSEWVTGWVTGWMDTPLVLIMIIITSHLAGVLYSKRTFEMGAGKEEQPQVVFDINF